MAGTIIVDRIESDASYASTINVAGQITFSNTVNFGAFAGTAPVAGFYLPTTNNLAFTTASTERMRIDSAGKVGIGTSSIATNFRQEIVGLSGSNTGAASSGTTQNASAVMRIRPGGGFTGTLDIGQGGGTGSWIQSTDTANLATTYPLLLNPVGGDVGIGTSAPAFTSGTGLEVQRTGDATVRVERTDATISAGEFVASSGLVKIGATGGTPFSFITDNTERMRIDSSGNLMLGTTTSAGKFTCDVAGSRFTSGTASAFLNWKGTTGRPCIQVQSIQNGEDTAFRSAAYDGTNSIYWTFGQNISTGAGPLDFMYATTAGTQTAGSGTTYVRFTNSGQVYNTTGTYGTISDAKLKENITDATPKLADLMRLQVRNFNLKTDATKAKQLGFIAQEMQQVFPACVEAFDDIDQETKEKTGETLTVKTAILIPMLVKAIQELKAINDTQAETINALTARITALESN